MLKIFLAVTMAVSSLAAISSVPGQPRPSSDLTARSGGQLTDLRIYSEHGGPVTIETDGRTVTVNAPKGRWETIKIS